ncbi:MAG TPA: hypothetical protein DEP87_03080 [Candidatus Pacebacteria bacterium]|nr:hypothetical protein [Candidatus Paceibacterota bacterium]
MGGKGCPSIIHAISLTNVQDTEVKTCDEVFQQFFKNYSEENQNKYSQFIYDTYQNLSYLGSVSLKKNNIGVNVEFISENVAEDGEVYWREFDAIISQDGKSLTRTRFRGCSKDQPHIFEGYRIPNTDSMAILISNKGDCFEGGYVNESLHVIKGIKYYDTNIVRSIKEESATEPNTGNMVVYATSKDVVNDNNANSTSTTSPVPQKNSVAEIILMVTIFVVGTTLGYVVGRKSARPQSPSNPTN